MSLDSPHGGVENGGNFLVAAAFLIVQGEDGAIPRSQLEQCPFDGFLHLRPFGEDGRAGTGMGESTGFVIVKGRSEAGLFPVAKFIVYHVDDNAIEESRNLRVAAKVRQGAEQAEEHFLRHVFEPVAFSREARERAEDHLLVAFDELLEILQGDETALSGNCFTIRRMG